MRLKPISLFDMSLSSSRYYLGVSVGAIQKIRCCRLKKSKRKVEQAKVADLLLLIGQERSATISIRLVLDFHLFVEPFSKVSDIQPRELFTD